MPSTAISFSCTANSPRWSVHTLIAMIMLHMTLVGCSPTVRVEAPREPITINLNIKLDADVRVKLEQQAKDDVARNPIF